MSILHCDMVGSTALADSYDPEAFEEIIQSFFDICIDLVERNRGVFANHSGDGFQAYFFPAGEWPGATDAIACGLGISQALRSRTLAGGQPLDARIGIATGEVVLSTQRRRKASDELVAFGAPAHRAGRLQSIAPPGEVYVDDVSHDLAKQYFDFAAMGEHALKGFGNPTEVWRVVRQRHRASRFAERRARLSPLVGRTQEIELLLDRWRAAGEEEGQAVVLTGEPGIGKSRVVYEVCRRVKRRPIAFQCVENFENTPLHPWIQFVERRAKIEPRDRLEIRRTKMEQLFNRALPLGADHRGVLLALMSYPSERPVDDGSTPERKLEALRRAIVDLTLQRTRRRPLLIVVEDIQWIDPSSRALLDSLVEGIVDSSVLLLITRRPENPIYYPGTHVTHLSLNRLTRSQVVTLAKEVMRTGSDRCIAEIAKWSDGIPFYVEEMARTALDAGDTTCASEPTGTRDHPQIPDSLQGPLLSRLDQLGPSKELAQVAAVIGRDFERHTLASLMQRESTALDRDLQMLLDSGVLIRRDALRETYSFKHALIQEAAYKNLLHRDVVVLHRRLAEIFSREFPEMRSTHPEQLAYHSTLSEQWEAAAQLWLRAGHAARDTGSHLEALGRLNRGLEAVAHLAATRVGKELRARLQMARGHVINAHFGPVNRDARDAFKEAVEIADALGEEDLVVTAQTALMTLEYVLGTFVDAEATASKLTDLATRAGRHQAAAIGLMGSGMCRFAMGEFAHARDRLRESLEYLEMDIPPAEGYPSKAYTYLGLTEHIMGEPETAVKLCDRAVEISREHQPIDLAAALGNSLYLHYMQGQLERIDDASARLMTLAEDRGLLMWYFQGRFFLGCALAAKGRFEGIAMMQEAMERFRQAQEIVEQSFFYGVLAERCLELDHADLARQWVEKGLSHVLTYGERFYESPLLRLEARCLQAGSPPGDAGEIAALLRSADETASRQGAIAFRSGSVH